MLWIVRLTCVLESQSQNCWIIFRFPNLQAEFTPHDSVRQARPLKKLGARNRAIRQTSATRIILPRSAECRMDCMPDGEDVLFGLMDVDARSKDFVKCTRRL